MVIRMTKQKSKYQWILDTYPETISKEQLYKLCQVSKKTAQHYLVNGLIPCENTGKKTRQYTIRTTDVVAFLEARDRDPDIFLAPFGWYQQYPTVHRPRIHSIVMQQKLRTALDAILQSYPDVLTSDQVATITGYHHETVVRWCSKKKLEFFCVRRCYLIPTVSLVEYLTANRCHAINDTAKEHILLNASKLEQSE